MRYYYLDHATGKIRYTKGEFVGWMRGGHRKDWYACFLTNGGKSIRIPERNLTAETRAAMPLSPTLQHEERIP